MKYLNFAALLKWLRLAGTSYLIFSTRFNHSEEEGIYRKRHSWVDIDLVAE
jgi:hypothetical protein